MLSHALFMGCVMNMANERYGMDYFNDMVERCYTFATELTEKQGHLIGTLCEYTPRELILAAGAWPVCLCGGDEAMIPAAETILPANICPLIKSTFGYSVNEANPFLQMASLTIAETTCDGKKKMYEQLMKRHPMHVLELPQKANDPDAHEHWYRELLKLRSVLEQHVGVTITDERLREAIRRMNRERRLRLALADLMQEDRPPLMGRELLNLKSLIAGLPDDLAAYERILKNLAQRPMAERSSGHRPRVLLTGVPCPHCAERIVDLIEREGGLIVVQENCTGIKPILRQVPEDAEDPIRALADYYFAIPCSVMTPNTARQELIRELVKRFRVDCIVELVWQCCLTYDIESAQTRATAASLGLPYLKIETGYSPHDDARLAVRIGALFEMCEDD